MQISTKMFNQDSKKVSLAVKTTQISHDTDIYSWANIVPKVLSCNPKEKKDDRPF